ncbi:MAG: hypothetical protein ACRDAI_06200 [Candidatus Rhabdochlamydia sp.]
MNKILKIITACFVLPASFLCAGSQEVQDEKQNDYCCVENSFGYLNIGIRGPLSQLAPSFGIGYRAQKDHHGFDVSGSIDYFHDRTTARLNVLYNYFFKPNLESQFFAGLGLEAKAVYVHGDSCAFPCPIFAIGQEFKTKAGSQRIVQLKVICPDEYVPLPLPEVILSYGFGF